ncbi:MarC family protein [Odoribacter sp. OttesenSCG-928-J03]|nr:MarC family protein [Odoribacter sp. OttesenSCG-928-J03]MDL2331194.1 MarC family protein [Odoribacter sp. OttesenSCG-928-A06]
MLLKELLSAFIAFLALVNPFQKLFVTTMLRNHYKRNELQRIVTRSNLTALMVLMLFLFVGEFVLNHFFHLQIYAFQFTCGLVLLYNGLMGLQKGSFLTIGDDVKVEDIIAVPLAIPMIAGPATITAVVSMPSIYGKWVTVGAVVLAIAVNWLVMWFSEPIGKFFTQHNMLMPLIRIMGLIVAAIGVQMMFNALIVFMGIL